MVAPQSAKAHSTYSLLDHSLSYKLPRDPKYAKELFTWSFTKCVFMAEKLHMNNNKKKTKKKKKKEESTKLTSDQAQMMP